MKGPAYLFSRTTGAWKTVERRLRSAHCIALFLDYDGTLTPIRRTPSSPVPSPKAQNALRCIARLPNVRVTMVTGRELQSIRNVLPLENIWFAANHGFHILQNGSEWIHPVAASIVPKLGQLYSVLRIALKDIPGAFIENKLFTLSVHYRNVDARKAGKVIALTKSIVRSYGSSLLLTGGKKVLEVRPNVRWGKGDAALKIFNALKPSGRALPLCIGDDKSDEDVFRALRSKGITVRVGKNRRTRAQYYVRNVEEALQLLKRIELLGAPVSEDRRQFFKPRMRMQL